MSQVSPQMLVLLSYLLARGDNMQHEKKRRETDEAALARPLTPVLPAISLCLPMLAMCGAARTGIKART
jgi:hypothetical protein